MDSLSHSSKTNQDADQGASTSGHPASPSASRPDATSARTLHEGVRFAGTPKAARNPLERGVTAETTSVTPVTTENALRATAQTPERPSPRRKWRIAAWSLIGVSVLGGSAAAYMLGSASPETTARPVAVIKATPTPVPTPVTKASSLTGLPIDPSAALKPVYGVMIENLAQGARPQSGLADAGVVYEALAEGGITRFLALYADGEPKSIGPVRSLRPYYIDWAMEYGAALAHAGGSSDALNLAISLKIKDLNALAIGAPTFFRTSDRQAPHNMYTSSGLMGSLVKSFRYDQAPSFEPTPRKADTPAQTPTNPNINISFSTADYAVGYAYQAATNSYARSNGGRAHVDRNTGTQIMVKNVVIEYMPITYTPAPHGSQYINMPTVGGGKAVVFRDGTAVTGTWSKSSRESRTKLLDANGQEIKLNAGNTWYEIVPNDRTVSF